MLASDRQPGVHHAQPRIGGTLGVKGLVSEQVKGASQRRQKQMEDLEISKSQGYLAESKLPKNS